MEQKVRDVLENAFPGINVETEILPGGRISGFVVWAGFIGMDQVDRQTKVRDALRLGLGEEAQEVGVLLTYTPDEMDAMSAA